MTNLISDYGGVVFEDLADVVGTEVQHYGAHQYHAIFGI